MLGLPKARDDALFRSAELTSYGGFGNNGSFAGVDRAAIRKLQIPGNTEVFPIRTLRLSACHFARLIVLNLGLGFETSLSNVRLVFCELNAPANFDQPQMLQPEMKPALGHINRRIGISPRGVSFSLPELPFSHSGSVSK